MLKVHVESLKFLYECWISTFLSAHAQLVFSLQTVIQQVLVITVSLLTSPTVTLQQTRYINDTDPSGYIIYPNCPFDYCKPQTLNVSINLNVPNGADAQCANRRTKTLCGACREHLSLSLGTSRCLPCPSHWPAMFVVILLAAFIAGILLVTALLALNMTVAVGLIQIM